MSLTDAKIRKLKRSAKPFKISDSRGLYLLVNAGGSLTCENQLRVDSRLCASCRRDIHDDEVFSSNSTYPP